MSREKRELVKICASAILLLAGLVLPHLFTFSEYALIAIFLAANILVGLDVYISAAKNILRRDFLDEKFLMSVASIGAFAIGEYAEGVAVLLFFSVGELFERKAVAHSRNSIKALMKIRPDTACVLRDGEELSLDAEDVEVGDTVILRAGERVAVDCVVIQGQGDVDCSAVTGESVPVSVCEGMEICSGCVNISSQLIAKAVRTCENSAAARILSLVEEASDKKSKQEKFITSFSRYYTPIVVFCAVLLALVPPLFDGMSFSSWIHRALMFLVVSCPCALVISVPLSFFGGIGAAAKRGILYKGGSSFDAMRNVGTAVFDKTGTLTTGDFTVWGIYPCANVDEGALLALAAMAEHSSSHPIAKAVKKEYGKPTSPLEECKEIAGQGVIATIEGSVVRVGNHRLMQSAGIAYTAVESCCLHVSRDNEYLGYITVTDEIKSEARTALAELRSLGVKRIVMLTGDKSESAEKVAKELEIDEYHASLLPQDKYAILERELACANGRVIFVGDGINDAPVIARADVGIAMGNVGSDAAIEASDVVIMSGNLDRLPEAVKIGKKTLRIATQNIFVAVGIKLAVLALCALGVIGMWWAVFADVGVAVVAILNSMRTLHYNPK